MGQRLTTMTSGQARFPVAPSQVQVRPARRIGHVAQRAPALDGQVGRRDRTREDGLDRSDQPRPGGHLHLHRPSASRPAQPGLVAQLRPGHDEPEPARVRRDDRVRGRARRPRRRFTTASGARAACRPSIRASRFVLRATRCCSCRTRRESTPPPAGARSTPSTD